jgi:putative endonuclease
MAKRAGTERRRADPRHTLGLAGEQAACDELARRGYQILARRYRTRAGEVDVVARDGATVVFVEVKTRVDDAYGGGAAAVTWQKRQRLARVAIEFLARYGHSNVPCRFDVVVVTPADVPRVEVYTHAFMLE